MFFRIAERPPAFVLSGVLMTPFRDTSLPRPAAILGAAGLIPFIALAVQVATVYPMGAAMRPAAQSGLVWYGAIILSFLGGVQWGLAVSSADRSDAWRRYGFSVLPAVVALLGLWLDGRNGLIALAIALGIWGAYELWSTGLGEAPQWYGHLRIALTVVSVAAVGLAAAYGPR
jgi:Protein of unknown function (DUF3429)